MLHPATRERLRRHLTPRQLWLDVRRVAGKLWSKVVDPDNRVISLSAAGPTARGRALVSFWIDPFLVKPGEPVPIAHTHYWESGQIARTWAELGYDVDVIHWTNLRFQPEHRYDVFVDVRLNMERLAPLLGDDCLKIQHIETGHHRFHNAAQRARLEELYQRRGVRIKPQKLIEVNQAIEHAHYGTTTGNDFTIGTYAHAGRDILRVGISAPHLYPSPETKDFESCRRRFLWFGSAGMVHKGLDLVLEAFRDMPGFELVVCGPVGRERDFEKEYEKELYDTPNITTLGWMHNGSPEFQRVVDSCLGLVYPSCSEGGGGSVITCLHAGLIPILTYETSVDMHDFGVELEDPAIDTIRRSVEKLSSQPLERLRQMAVGAWQHARSEHTREHFAAGYRGACEQILSAWHSRR